MASERIRAKIGDGLMALAAERPFAGIGLAEIAAEAGVSLAVLREAFPSRLAILRDVFRRVDAKVLAAPAEGETVRDRLFDMLMRRFDALEPHRAAVRNLVAAARRDPCLALALGSGALASISWMCPAAGIPTGGPGGAAKVHGAAFAYRRALQVWLDDDEPGLDRTMAALDAELRRGERALAAVGRVRAFCKAFRRPSDGRAGAATAASPPAAGPA